MYHNRAASYIWVSLGETLTAAYQAEAIRRLADALGMTVVREYEDEEYGISPGDRPQFQRMMEEAGSEPNPSAPSSPKTACGSPRARPTWRGTPGNSRTPESSCSACGTSRQGTPQGPGVPA